MDNANENDIRVRLTVMGLSYSQIQTGAYALILAQVNGPYRIPVVIGPAEAQSIALRLENIAPSRPMTHDLFVSFAHAFGIKLLEVFIYRFEDGVFSSEITFSDGDRKVVIDSRTSDAIAIAMRTQTPIYTTQAILEATGFILEATEGTDEPLLTADEPSQSILEKTTPSNDTPRLENYAIEELERELDRLISNEDYEGAAKVKEILDAKKNKDNDSLSS